MLYYMQNTYFINVASYITMQLYNASESFFHVLSKAKTYRACPRVSSLYLMNDN